MNRTRKGGLPKEYIVGIDVGGTKSLLIIEDLDGNRVYSRKTCSVGHAGEIGEFVEACINQSGVLRDGIIGVGMGLPGRVDPDLGVVIDAPAFSWRGFEVREFMEDILKIPVHVENDVNLALLGVKYRGGFESSRDILYLALGTGLGSAIMANDRLVRGSRYSAGEVGYFISRWDLDNQLFNQPGEFGLMEKKVSGTALDKECRKHGLDPMEVFDLYISGDRGAKAIIEEFVKELSILISNTVSLLNPEVVVLGGGVSESMGCVLKQIQSMCERITPIKTRIILCPLKNEAAAFGAVELVKRASHT